MSTSGGSSWFVIDAYHYGDGIFVVNDPGTDSIFWTGGKYGYMSVCKSTDAGYTWTRYNLTENDGWAYAMAIDPNNSNVVYTGGVPELFKTTNFGATWDTIMDGLTGTTYAIKINPQSTNIVYTGTSDGIFKSYDNGNQWTYLDLDDVYAIAINPNTPEIIYSGTLNGIFYSTDAGSSWKEYSNGLDDFHITAMEVDPDNYVYAGTYYAGLYRSSIQIPVTEKSVSHWKSWITFNMANPVRKNMLIKIKISTDEAVNLKIYDRQGRMVKTLARDLTGGDHGIFFNGYDDRGLPISTGVYFLQASSKMNSLYKKFVFLKN